MVSIGYRTQGKQTQTVYLLISLFYCLVKTKDFSILKIKTFKNRIKKLLQIKHKDKTNEISEFQGCAFTVMVIQISTTTP